MARADPGSYGARVPTDAAGIKIPCAATRREDSARPRSLPSQRRRGLVRRTIIWCIKHCGPRLVRRGPFLDIRPFGTDSLKMLGERRSSRRSARIQFWLARCHLLFEDFYFFAAFFGGGHGSW
jgi:hypothetical protein